MKRVYLDHAATTPVTPEVIAAMMPLLEKEFGNPSALNAEGRKAAQAVDRARGQVAVAIGAKRETICFTSGGSEADNMALKGIMRHDRHHGGHLITTAVEHHAILHTCDALNAEGFEITILPVNAQGMVDPDDVRRAIRPDTRLISVMTANNEVGTLQPIAEIGHISREMGILFHTDAVQALGNIPLDVDALNVDLMSLSSHKIYGPKGVGALYIRQGIGIDSIIHGGQQEYHRRAGTENTCGIVGFGKACESAAVCLSETAEQLKGLQKKLIESVLSNVSGVQLTGDPVRRLPGNVHFCFEGVKSEALLTALDMAGIAASSGSACTSGIVEPSHVLSAMGIPDTSAQGALRLTLGRSTTAEAIDYVIDNLVSIINRLRR